MSDLQPHGRGLESQFFLPVFKNIFCHYLQVNLAVPAGEPVVAFAGDVTPADQAATVPVADVAFSRSGC